MSAKYLLRRAVACAALARETEDDECRQRALRLQQVYLRLAECENSDSNQQANTGGREDIPVSP